MVQTHVDLKSRILTVVLPEVPSLRLEQSILEFHFSSEYHPFFCEPKTTISDVLVRCCSATLSAVIFPITWLAYRVASCFFGYKRNQDAIDRLQVPLNAAHRYVITDPGEIQNAMQRMYTDLFVTCPLQTPSDFERIVQALLKREQQQRIYIRVEPRLTEHLVDFFLVAHTLPEDSDPFRSTREIRSLCTNPCYRTPLEEL